MMAADNLPVRMIVSDLDRTLLRSDKTISEYSVRILKGCQARGIKVVFATDRPERATRRFQDGIIPDYVIANNGGTKRKAILYLCEKLGYSLGELAAFGDDSNDLEMVQACGRGIAVRNAIPEVQAVADWVCDSNDDDGVARWLEEHVLK